MEKHRDSMPGQEGEVIKGKEEKQDETEEQSNKRMTSVDSTSAETEEYDSSADDELSDNETENQPRELSNDNETRETSQSWGLLDSIESYVSLLSKDSEGAADSAELAELRAALTEARLEEQLPSSSKPERGDELSEEEPHRSLPRMAAENQPRSPRELNNVMSTDTKETTEKSQFLGHLESLEPFKSFESLSCEDENVEGKSELAQIRSASTESRLESYQAFLGSLNTLNAGNNNETEPSGSETERGLRWANKEKMLSSLKNEPHLRMQAVCALHRRAMAMHVQQKMMGTPWILDWVYEKLSMIAKFLTDDDVLGPCKRTSDELEAMYGNAAAYCSLLVSTYSTEIYEIYLEGFDLDFP